MYFDVQDGKTGSLLLDIRLSNGSKPSTVNRSGTVYTLQGGTGRSYTPMYAVLNNGITPPMSTLVLKPQGLVAIKPGGLYTWIEIGDIELYDINKKYITTTKSLVSIDSSGYVNGDIGLGYQDSNSEILFSGRGTNNPHVIRQDPPYYTPFTVSAQKPYYMKWRRPITIYSMWPAYYGTIFSNTQEVKYMTGGYRIFNLPLDISVTTQQPYPSSADIYLNISNGYKPVVISGITYKGVRIPDVIIGNNTTYNGSANTYSINVQGAVITISPTYARVTTVSTRKDTPTPLTIRSVNKTADQNEMISPEKIETEVNENGN